MNCNGILSKNKPSPAISNKVGTYEILAFLDTILSEQVDGRWESDEKTKPEDAFYINRHENQRKNDIRFYINKKYFISLILNNRKKPAMQPWNYSCIRSDKKTPKWKVDILYDIYTST